MRGQILKSATESHESNEKRNSRQLSNQIQQVLENENLVRKQISEEQDSLFRAFSEGLYLTPNYYHQIKELLFRNLYNLITTNTLPPKLEIFRGNSVLWSDYSKDPSSPDFFRINLELFSFAFKVRVVVYTVTTDGILNAKIFNNKFDKTVQFINPYGAHLDVVYTKGTMQTIGSCQNIATNIVENVIEGKHSSQDIEWKDFNKQKISTSETSAKASTESKLEESKKESKIKETKRQHKKSKSESDLKCIDQFNSYNMFVDLKPSEEFSKMMEQDLSKLGQSPDISLIQEPRLSFGEKNVSSEAQPNLGLTQVRSFPNERRVILEEADEDILSPEMLKFEKSKSYIDPTRFPQKSPTHFSNLAPPGLTPNRYNTKTYGAESFTQATTTAETQPTKHRLSESHSHGLGMDLSQQANGAHSTTNKPRMAARTLSLSTHSEEFSKLPVNGGNVNQGLEANPPLSRAQSQRVSSGTEKKKPVIIDESQHRYTGRLKFFDEGKNYGFIVMDDDGSDIFVHYDDLHKANINKEFLKSARFGNSIRLTFSCMEYIGKYNRSRKATDIQFLT